MAETSFHLAMSREPTRGSRSTQSGGGGTDHVASHCAPLAISCECARIVMVRWSYFSPRGGEASLRGECTLSLAAENRNVRSADERRPSRARRALGHHPRRRRRHPAATAHPPDLGRHTPRPRLAGGGGRTGRPL